MHYCVQHVDEVRGDVEGPPDSRRHGSVQLPKHGATDGEYQVVEDG